MEAQRVTRLSVPGERVRIACVLVQREDRLDEIVAQARAKDATREPGGTSHFVIVDAAGNVVSMTTTIESPFGRFSFTIEVEGTLVRVKSALDVTRARIAADDYLRFRSFLGEIDAALAQPLVIAPPSAGDESEKAR